MVGQISLTSTCSGGGFRAARQTDSEIVTRRDADLRRSSGTLLFSPKKFTRSAKYISAAIFFHGV